ncbi:MAG TPA: thioesterase family protein [Candidatus Angelobacter sp.]|nr:thioesterase family protein [Candidatus Angelobacter sp.]
MSSSAADRFRYYLRVRYSECDAQKVVFNSRYGDYIDLATTEFLRALGYGDALFSGELDFQLVKQTVEWKAPARFDQVLEISVHAARVGTTSFTLVTTFRVAADDRIIATGETVYVLVTPHTLVKTPIPSELRAAMERGATGQVVDHASYLPAPAPQK